MKLNLGNMERFAVIVSILISGSIQACCETKEENVFPAYRRFLIVHVGIARILGNLSR